MDISVSEARTETSWTRRLTLAAGLGALGIAAVLATTAALAQDAAVVDADHYKVEFENDQVRVLRINYGSHEKSVMHSHPDGVAVFLDDLNSRFTMPDGETVDMEVTAGTVAWTEAQDHLPENLGDAPFEVIQVELKAAAKNAAAKDVIRANIDRFVELWNVNDKQGVASLLADDIFVMPPDGESLTGPDAVIENMFAAYDITQTQQTASTNEVLVYGDRAHALGTWQVAPTAAGSELPTGGGKWFVVLKRQSDGSWRMWRWMWNQPTPVTAS